MNSLVVLAVIVSLATLVMLGINLYMIITVKKERNKNFILRQNIGALAVVIRKKLDQQKTNTMLASSQTEDFEGFLNNIEIDLNQISHTD